MIPALEHRGFGYGSGLLSSDCTQFIVNIPKNASSYMVDWACRHKWSSAMVGDACSWNKVNEMVVILRDPTQRWVSGICQYLNTYILSVSGPNGPIFPGDHITKNDWTMDADQFLDFYNQTTERLIFDVINRFDDHVWPQYEFFENLMPTVPRKYFYMDTSFDHKIAEYLNFEPFDHLDRNSSRSNVNMQKLNAFFVEKLQTRPELKKRVALAYARDYEIIDQAFNQ